VQLGSLGGRCKLLQRGLGRSPSGNQLRCILAWKSNIWWHQFFISLTFPKNILPWPFPDFQLPLKFPDFFQLSLTCRNPERQHLTSTDTGRRHSAPSNTVLPVTHSAYHKSVKGYRVCIALRGKPISELRSIACHMESHSVTHHPTQAYVPHLNSSQTRRYCDLPTVEGWKAELTLVVGYMPRWFTCPQTVTRPSSNHLIATRPGVKPTTSWS